MSVAFLSVHCLEKITEDLSLLNSQKATNFLLFITTFYFYFYFSELYWNPDYDLPLKDFS